MIRRFALTLASSAVVCALAVSLTTAFTNAQESSRILASDTTHTSTDASVERSGYIVASS